MDFVFIGVAAVMAGLAVGLILICDKLESRK
ncbi:hypothetical protein BH10PSE17_BH10PSE17_15220 [soil metagenome]